MELYEALMTTRAMRRYSDEPVSDATIQRILRAAVQAPSGGNIQPYQFLVVTEQDVKDRIAAIYLKAHERYEPAIQKYVPPFKDADAEKRHQRNWKATDDLARSLASVPAMILVIVPKISMAIEDDEGVMDVGPVYASVYPAVQNLILAARSEGDLRVVPTEPDHARIPASDAEMNAARFPSSIARRPRAAISPRRWGANPPIPPIWIAIDEKFAKPSRA